MQRMKTMVQIRDCSLFCGATHLWMGLTAAVSFSLGAGAADITRLTVRADQPGATPTQFGIFYEDINFAGDGGLYAELVKNRSFEFENHLAGWKQLARGGVVGTVTVQNSGPLNPANPQYVNVTVTKAGQGFGLVNEGSRGIGARQGAGYNFSVFARKAGSGEVTLQVELESPTGQILGTGKIKGFTQDWRKQNCSIRVSATEPKARLNVLVVGEGALDMDMISLFPKETWGHRPNGLRTDLVQKLKDLKPAFMRFPGGCIVEGTELQSKPGVARPYRWKDTIGDVSTRPGNLNRWNYSFKDRRAPDYYQSYGLGFFEFFQLCEDIGASPLPILNCGMACQFESKQLVPLDQLDPLIQDALDLIEFANGSADSTWGRKRAEMGHAKPFRVQLIGVGNEQWGPDYFLRYERFAKAIKAKYPAIKIVTSSGPSPDGKDFDFAWGKAREFKADIVDEHYYREPAWFLSNSHRYDRYDSTGPKVFAGEYAAQSVAVCSPLNRSTWECALAEAAFMTGLERNSKVVAMSSYAPLLGHDEAWQWCPNLIWFDNLRSFGTASYCVQQLFAVQRGDAELPVNLELAEPQGGAPFYACAARDGKAGEVIIKLVNVQPFPRQLQVKIEGVKRVARSARGISVANSNLKAENCLDEPRNIAPTQLRVSLPGAEFPFLTLPYSVTVLRVGYIQ